MSMITGKTILGFFKNPEEASIKNSTYYLRIGEIFEPGDSAMKPIETGSFLLRPRGMVWVLSKEEFIMPKDVTGLATLRTTYTKQGILALNVGVLDPFFKGPISTALINFSDKTRVINVGDEFFRVMFFSHESVEKTKSEYNISKIEYVADLKNSLVDDFSNTFMDIQKIEKMRLIDFAKKSILAPLSKYLPPILSVVAGILIVLSLITAGLYAIFDVDDRLDFGVFELRNEDTSQKIQLDFFSVSIKDAPDNSIPLVEPDER